MRFSTLALLLACSFFLVACSSDKAKVQKLAEDELTELAIRWLPSGSEFKSGKTTITAMSGLDFTGTATLVFELPELYTPFGPHVVFEPEHNEKLWVEFQSKLGEVDSSTGREVFDTKIKEALDRTTPAFYRLKKPGQKIRVVFPSFDGRRSGESVKFQSVANPEIQWSELGIDIQQVTIATNPPDTAHIFDDATDFLTKFETQFTGSADASRDEIAEEIRRKVDATQKLLVGEWKGRGQSRIVDVTNYEMEVSFTEDHKVSGKLRSHAIVNAIGTTDIRKELHFSGEWNLSGGTLNVTARQLRWTTRLEQLRGPDSDKPASQKEKRVSPDPFDLKFLLDRDSEAMTWMAAGSKIVNAEDEPLVVLSSISLSKISDEPKVAEEAPSTAPSEPPEEGPRRIAPMALPDDVQVSPATPAPQAGGMPTESGTASSVAGSSDGSTARKIQPIDSIENIPTFTPMPESGRETAKTSSFPPNQKLEGERYPQTRMVLLDVSQIRNLSLDDIQFALNEMYARHGLTFKDKQLQSQFEQFPWYRPNQAISSAEIETAFSEIETANRQMLVDRRAELRESGTQRGPSSQTTQTPSPKAATQRPPSTVFSPKDKLPKNVEGLGVAGDFLLIGTDSRGRPRLIAKEDQMNPFQRTYVVVDEALRDNSNVVLQIADYRPLSFSRKQPLIFVGRGDFPGSYLVRLPQ